MMQAHDYIGLFYHKTFTNPLKKFFLTYDSIVRALVWLAYEIPLHYMTSNNGHSQGQKPRPNWCEGQIDSESPHIQKFVGKCQTAAETSESDTY